MNKFYHSGSMGDIIYALPTVIAMGGGQLHLRRKKDFDFLWPLLERQDYISLVVYNQDFPTLKNLASMIKRIDGFINLDIYRNVEQYYSELQISYHLANSHLSILGLHFDLAKSWLEVDRYPWWPIVVNRTQRYHDIENIDWKILRKYCDQILFIGSNGQYDEFVKLIGCPTQYKKCADALEMARIIRGSKLFIGNQSLGFAIAEAMKHSRVLEVCKRKDNCRPNGPDGYTELSEDILKKYL